MPQSNKMHAVPQNIMDVEFKLIGDLTLRQFIYLFVFGGGAYISFVVMVGLFKWPTVLLFVLLGIGLAFVPIQERGLDEWIVNFIKSVYSPTQRIWQKEPTVPSAFMYENLAVVRQELITLAPTSSRRRLEEYLEYKVADTAIDPLDIPEKEYIMKVRAAFGNVTPSVSVGVYEPDSISSAYPPSAGNQDDYNYQPNNEGNTQQSGEYVQVEEYPQEQLPLENNLPELPLTEEVPAIANSNLENQPALPSQGSVDQEPIISPSQQAINPSVVAPVSSDSQPPVNTQVILQPQSAVRDQPQRPANVTNEGDSKNQPQQNQPQQNQQRQNDNNQRRSAEQAHQRQRDQRTRNRNNINRHPHLSLSPMTPDMHSGRRFINLVPKSGELILPIRGERVIRTSEEMEVETDIREKAEKLNQLLSQIKRETGMETENATRPQVIASPVPPAPVVDQEAKSLAQQLKGEQERLSQEITKLETQTASNVAEENEKDSLIQRLKVEKERTQADYEVLQKQILELQDKLRVHQTATVPTITSASQVMNSNPSVKMDGRPNILYGLVKTKEGNVKEGILIIVKNNKGEAVRAVKTNALGEFKLTTPLANGNYILEVASNNTGSTFDIISVEAKGVPIYPVELIGH